MTTTPRPSQPSSEAIAAELGIAIASPGWRAAVRARRGETTLQREWLAAHAAWEAATIPAHILAAREERNSRLAAAGLNHLIGATIHTSRRGTLGAVHGNRVYALNAAECVALGRTPGPGNF